ncbi:MAG: pantoate--beta-alanine ligase [Pseudolabrys sp.]|nr:pantoate--beta-alanine ligase [Pseudolabrys sp.]MBV9260733.1 pantoate--beta-alanine ligase [Pseudolabrys sp.]
MAARPRTPKVARTIVALRKALDARPLGSVALVPTMGALHAGHLTLVRQAQKRARRVVVSIFVNPTQFAPHEDFGSYPRTWNADIAALAAEKADLIWAPTPEVMYPQGFATRIEPDGAAKAGLEDKFRPHFFGGVATVVAKLFTQVRPDFAMFGEKDYQQLCVVTQMARDLDLGVKVVGVPTVREKDGLALSSRNAYLAPIERAVAPVLHRSLATCAADLKNGMELPDALARGRAAIERAGFKLDYFELRQAKTLAPVSAHDKGPLRLLVAAAIGKTRLIDNISV